MPNIDDGDEEINLNIDDLFKDPDEEPTEEPNEGSEDNGSKPDTAAVSKRINEVRSKTEHETQERIAKDLGYESYAAMMEAKSHAKEKKILEEAGLDEEDVSDAVQKLVDQKLANDPRFKRLQEYDEREKAEFVKKQLNEVNKLSGQNFTSIDQLPPETLELWGKIGNLKQAFLATHGEEVIARSSGRAASGSLDHLAFGGGSGTATKTRKLTDEEKALYRSIYPDITDEELNKKTTKI